MARGWRSIIARRGRENVVIVDGRRARASDRSGGGDTPYRIMLQIEKNPAPQARKNRIWELYTRGSMLLLLAAGAIFFRFRGVYKRKYTGFARRRREKFWGFSGGSVKTTIYPPPLFQIWAGEGGDK